MEYKHLTKRDEYSQHSLTINIKWNPPKINSFKLNTDGSCLGNLGKEGINGVVRMHNGGWVMGFCKSFHKATNNMMELMELIEGLKMVEQKNFLPIEINIGSLEIIIMLTNGNLHYDALILDCRSRLRTLGNQR